MPITVECPCSRTFEAPDHLAGNMAHCPTCQSEILIPGAQANNSMNDLLDEVGISLTTSGAGKCPKCFAPLEPQAVLCVNCGTNLQSGESVIVQKKKKRPGEGASYTDVSLGDARLDRALVELEKDREEAKKSHDPIAWWIYLAVLDLILSVCITFAIMMMTNDDLKSSRMQMMNIDYTLVEESADDIYVIATATAGYSNSPPYSDEDTGQPVMSNTMGRKTDSNGSYSFIVTPQKGSFWIANTALQHASAAALQAKLDAEQVGAGMGELKYGFLKGLRVGMWTMLVLSTSILIVALGQITYIAFQEDISQGGLCLTIGYAPYYAISRSYKTGSPLRMFIFGTVLIVTAIIVILNLQPLLPLVRGMKDI